MPRGWQPQYPVPYSGQGVGVIPGRGGAAAAANRGRGAGSTRGAATGGRGGARRGQQVAPVADAQAPAEPLTIAQIKQYPVEQQKLYCGERLYALISPLQPILAGKITGMFLESGWPIEELFSLLTEETKLTDKIDDALSVLERAQQGQVGEGEEGAEHEETH